MTAFKDTVKSRRIWTPPTKKDEMFYRTTIHDIQSAGKIRHLAVVRLSKGLMKKLGWKIGDKVKLMQNEDNPLHLAMAKDETYGYVLLPAALKPEQTYKQAKGTIGRAYFSGQIDEETTMPRTDQTTVKVNEFDIVDGRLEFYVPRDMDVIREWLRKREKSDGKE